MSATAIFVKINRQLDLDRSRDQLSLKTGREAGERWERSAMRSERTSTRPCTAHDRHLRRAGATRIPGRLRLRVEASGLEGYDSQREEWESQYAEARSRLRGGKGAPGQR